VPSFIAAVATHISPAATALTAARAFAGTVTSATTVEAGTPAITRLVISLRAVTRQVPSISTVEALHLIVIFPLSTLPGKMSRLVALVASTVAALWAVTLQVPTLATVVA
jgi:hypothetical protein